MLQAFVAVDSLVAMWLPPLVRIILWAGLNAAISMGVYAFISPQQKILGLKDEQKSARRALLSYGGDLGGLYPLVWRDLRASLHQIAVLLLPFTVSLLPVLAGMYYLSTIFGDNEYINFGPGWMHGFEFIYIVTMIIVSLAIKWKFRIA